MSIASFPQRLRGSRPSARRHPRRWPVRLELTVWWRATELDRRIAAGEDPWTSDALALRARRLTAKRSRRNIADGLTSALRTAGNRGPRFTASVPARSENVFEAAAVIATIERRLRSSRPVSAQGIALMSLLLTDGNGPLYQPSAPGLLANRLRFAAAMLSAPNEAD